MVRAAVANKARHDEKRKKCQGSIKTFLPASRDQKTTIHSATAIPYIPCRYVQTNLTHLHVNVNREESANINRTAGPVRPRITNPQVQEKPHRKVKFARITAFLKIKDG